MTHDPNPPERLPRTDPRLWAPIIALGVARAAWGIALGFRPFDDTFITFRYALNIGEGNGFVYNVEQHVLGTTTPLWTMLLAVVSWSGIALAPAALVISLCCDIATALLLAGAFIRLRFSRATAVWSAALFLATFDFLSLSRSGMETSLFVFLVAATANRLAHQDWRRAAVACGCASLARPEGLLLVGILAIAMAIHRRSTTARDLARAGGILTMLLGAWAAYATWRFGSFVPHSLVAKAAAAGVPGLAAFSWRNLALFCYSGQYGGAVFARSLLQLNFVAVALAAVATGDMVRALLKSRTADSAQPVVVLLLFPSLYVAGLGATHAFTWYPWYYGPLYPFLSVLAVIGTGVSCRRLKATWRRIVPAAVCATLILAQIVTALAVKLPRDRDYWITGYLAASATIPRERGTRIAAFEIGVVGWQTWPAEIIDLAGLITPTAAGRTPAVILAETPHDYLVLRTDDAAEFLRTMENDAGLAARYQLVTAVSDPHVDRQFRTYLRRP